METFPVPTLNPSNPGPRTGRGQADPQYQKEERRAPPKAFLSGGVGWGLLGREPLLSRLGGRWTSASMQWEEGGSRAPCPKEKDPEGCQSLELQPCKPGGEKLRMEPNDAD